MCIVWRDPDIISLVLTIFSYFGFINYLLAHISDVVQMFTFMIHCNFKNYKCFIFSSLAFFFLVSDFIDKDYNIGLGAFPAHIYIGRWTLAYGISDSKKLTLPWNRKIVFS